METYARRHQPSDSARRITGRKASSDASTVIPMLRSVNASVAAVKTASALYDILDAHLATNDYLGGDRLTMADFPAGSLTDRWINWNPDRPSHPNVEAWYKRLAARPAYQAHVIAANAPRLAQIRAG